MMMKSCDFETLEGLTLAEVSVKEGGINDEVVFKTTKGREFVLFHDQDCCEYVAIEDICGDLEDLIGDPILLAEESTSENETPPGFKPPEYPDSFTWTFYRIATVNATITIRWFGESNGYYSEGVDFEEIFQGTK